MPHSFCAATRDVLERQREALVERPIGTAQLSMRNAIGTCVTPGANGPAIVTREPVDAGQRRAPCMHDAPDAAAGRLDDERRCRRRPAPPAVHDLEQVEHRQLIVLELDRKSRVGAEPQRSRCRGQRDAGAQVRRRRVRAPLAGRCPSADARREHRAHAAGGRHRRTRSTRAARRPRPRRRARARRREARRTAARPSVSGRRAPDFAGAMKLYRRCPATAFAIV